MQEGEDAAPGGVDEHAHPWRRDNFVRPLAQEQHHPLATPLRVAIRATLQLPPPLCERKLDHSLTL
jgi:hypothetical protein